MRITNRVMVADDKATKREEDTHNGHTQSQLVQN